MGRGPQRRAPLGESLGGTPSPQAPTFPHETPSPSPGLPAFGCSSRHRRHHGRHRHKNRGAHGGGHTRGENTPHALGPTLGAARTPSPGHLLDAAMHTQLTFHRVPWRPEQRPSGTHFPHGEGSSPTGTQDQQNKADSRLVRGEGCLSPSGSAQVSAGSAPARRGGDACFWASDPRPELQTQAGALLPWLLPQPQARGRAL